jgi:pimeloyl-ACP methyl ester carboxylesterase
MAEEFGRSQGPNGLIAWRRTEGKAPTIVFLGGFRSDMSGTKATALAKWAARNDRAFLRFDYSGHGASDGRFEDGAVSDWAADALFAISSLTTGPVCLVGSSMGAWIGALLAKSLAARIAGAVFVAPAPDFTERLLLPSLSPEQRRAVETGGRVVIPSAYSSEPEIFTRRLIEDGREQSVMPGPIAFGGPVHILHGKCDEDVPWRMALDFAAAINAPEIRLTLIQDGDHRLSRDQDLARLFAAVAALSA